MNNKIITISIIYSLSVLGMILAQPALAAEEKRSRFNFAPTRYKLEEAPDVPRSDPAHIAKNGNVPASSNFLGLSPAMLTKRAPVVQPVQVATPVAAPAPVAQNNVQGNLAKAPISPLFGKPGVLKVASAPAAAVAVPKVMHHAPLSADKDVHGVITSHRPHRSAQPNGLVAKGGGLDNYGKNFGYVPGAYLPSASTGDGSRTDTQVSATLLHR